MPKDEAHKAKASQSQPGKSSSTKSNAKPKPRSDGKAFGDACVRLTITDVQKGTRGSGKDRVEVMDLRLIIPPNARVERDIQGYVDGLPGASVYIETVSVGIATGYVIGKIDPSLLGAKTVTVFCAAPKVGMIEGKIKPRPASQHGEDLGTRRSGDTVVTIDVGKVHGVTKGMKGHVKGYRTLSFTISEVREMECEAVLVGAGSLKDVVINDPSSNR